MAVHRVLELVRYAVANGAAQALARDASGVSRFLLHDAGKSRLQSSNGTCPFEAGPSVDEGAWLRTAFCAAEKARKVIDTAGPGEPGKQATAGLRIPETGLARAERADSQQASDQSLSNKLLGYDGEQGGAEKLETTAVKGVY